MSDDDESQQCRAVEDGGSVTIGQADTDTDVYVPPLRGQSASRANFHLRTLVIHHKGSAATLVELFDGDSADGRRRFSEQVAIIGDNTARVYTRLNGLVFRHGAVVGRTSSIAGAGTLVVVGGYLDI
jgi:hypothetical protein